MIKHNKITKDKAHVISPKDDALLLHLGYITDEGNTHVRERMRACVLNRWVKHLDSARNLHDASWNRKKIFV